MNTAKKELTKTALPLKTRGAQPGNRNARTHGFYSRELTPGQMEALHAAHGVQADATRGSRGRCEAHGGTRSS